MNRIEHERGLCKHYWCFKRDGGGCSHPMLQSSNNGIKYATYDKRYCQGDSLTTCKCYVKRKE